MGLESRPKTVFFRLDPDAKYNDGVPVKAVDFMWWVPCGLGQRGYPLVQTVHSGAVVSIHSVWRRPDCDFSSRAQTQARLLRQLASLGSSFKEYGPDYKGAINGSAATTAAYTVKPGLGQGCSITLSRVDDWWAADKNSTVTVSTRTYPLYGGEGSLKAWELSGPGNRLLPHHFARVLVPKIGNASRIRRIVSATLGQPVPGFPSLCLNCAQAPLDDHDVASASHATNWQKVIGVIFRGDASRLPGWTKGYGRSTTPRSWPPFFRRQGSRVLREGRLRKGG